MATAVKMTVAPGFTVATLFTWGVYLSVQQRATSLKWVTLPSKVWRSLCAFKSIHSVLMSHFFPLVLLSVKSTASPHWFRPQWQVDWRSRRRVPLTWRCSGSHVQRQESHAYVSGFLQMMLDTKHNQTQTLVVQDIFPLENIHSRCIFPP